MRLAIVSDVHGNLSAFEAVVRDLRETTPDLVLHGGDLVTHGHRPAEVLDRVRELGWNGVRGNTDEMLWLPHLHHRLLQESPKLAPLYEVLFNALAPATRERIGEERLSWLQRFPETADADRVSLLHASPGNLWRAPMADADDEVLRETYDRLAGRVVVYGHIHRPFVRRLLTGVTVANTGSVGLSFDGDRRASYLVIDDDAVSIRRVDYDVSAEIAGLLASNYPHAKWIAGILASGRYSPP